MIEKIICENDTESNYEKLSEERKRKYYDIYIRAQCCPEEYILGVDLASTNSKDFGTVTKLNYREYLKGNMVVESIEYF